MTERGQLQAKSRPESAGTLDEERLAEAITQDTR